MYPPRITDVSMGQLAVLILNKLYNVNYNSTFIHHGVRYWEGTCFRLWRRLDQKTTLVRCWWTKVIVPCKVCGAALLIPAPFKTPVPHVVTSFLFFKQTGKSKISLRLFWIFWWVFLTSCACRDTFISGGGGGGSIRHFYNIHWGTFEEKCIEIFKCCQIWTKYRFRTQISAFRYHKDALNTVLGHGISCNIVSLTLLKSYKNLWKTMQGDKT